LRTHLQSSI